MLEFIQKYARSIAVLLAGIVSAFLADFSDVTNLETFFEMVIQDFGFTVGMVGTLLIGYIGEKRLLSIEANTTVTSVVAGLTAILPILLPDVDWNPLLVLLGDFANTATMTIGAAIAVFLNYFGDIRVGRSNPSDQFVADLNEYDVNTYGRNYYKLADFPSIVLTGRRSGLTKE